MKIFISGSRNLILNNEIIADINVFVEKNFEIIIGDADGVDTEVQKILAAKKYKNVKVYFSGKNPRNNIGSREQKVVQSFSKFFFYTAKDEKMTEDCDKGYVVWDGESKGTKSNIKRLQEFKKPVLVKIMTTDIKKNKKYSSQEVIFNHFQELLGNLGINQTNHMLVQNPLF